MSVWYTSDLHLDHAKVREMRGFGTEDEYREFLCHIWERVRPEDVVYILGDLTGDGRGEKEDAALAFLSELQGKKRIILGNHDSPHPMHKGAADGARLKKWLQSGAVESAVAAATRRVGDYRFTLSHFPANITFGDHTETNRYVEWRPPRLGENWKIIHGHTHLPTQTMHTLSSHFHVGLDAWYRLVSEQEIVDVFNGRKVVLAEDSPTGNGIVYGRSMSGLHARSKCDGEVCFIHNPSRHHMRGWPVVMRGVGIFDTSEVFFERTCEHGIGHPDPDQFAYWEKTGMDTYAVHGCDRCCHPPAEQVHES